MLFSTTEELGLMSYLVYLPRFAGAAARPIRDAPAVGRSVYRNHGNPVPLQV